MTTVKQGGGSVAALPPSMARNTTHTFSRKGTDYDTADTKEFGSTIMTLSIGILLGGGVFLDDTTTSAAGATRPGRLSNDQRLVKLEQAVTALTQADANQPDENHTA